jgi:hypothetical protein
MSIRAEYRLRQWVRLAASSVGTPRVSFALLALAAVYLAAASVWARVAPGDGAHALATSSAFGALAVALVLDALVSLGRARPREGSAGESSRPRPLAPSRSSSLLLRGAYLLAALAFTASWLARDVATLRVAAGEEATGAPEQLVAREPPRRFSPGPFAARFVVEAISGRPAPDGRTGHVEVTVRRPDGSRGVATPTRPLWFGWGRFLVPERTGLAVECELRVEGGATLESAIAKLDLLPPGRRESIRLATIPHRILVRVRPGVEPDAADPPALEVAVHRGKLAVASGLVAPGRGLPFEGLVLQIPRVHRWVEFRMIRDPGLGIAALAALLAVVGLALRIVGRAGVGPEPTRAS